MRVIWPAVFSLVLLALFCTQAAAFTGEGGTVDVNLGELFDSADSNVSGGTLNVSYVLGEVSAGKWRGGTIDANLGVYFTDNSPSISITSPANGATLTSSTVSLTYTSTAGTHPIAKHWVRIDSGSWIDNGLNTSYNFTSVSDGSHTLYAIATDSSDANSATASVTVTVSTSTGGGGDTGGGGGGGGGDGGGGGGGGGGGAGYASQEVLDNPLNLMAKRVYIDDPIEHDGGIITQSILIWRLIKTGTGATASYFTFIMNVKNASGTDYAAVNIDENVPRDIANHVKRIFFDDKPYKIVNPEPPEFIWRLEDFANGSDINLLWVVNGLSNKNVFDDKFEGYFKAIDWPVVTIDREAQEEVCPQNCDDGNPCTRDSCSGAQCVHTAASEGLACGDNKICSEGVCKDRSPTGQFVLPEIELPKFKDFVAAGIVVTVLVAWVLVSLFFVFYRRGKRHPWGLGDKFGKR